MSELWVCECEREGESERECVRCVTSRNCGHFDHSGFTRQLTVAGIKHATLEADVRACR